MAKNSKIEWTDATWNPVRGCSRVSEGCRNCYAETIAARFSDEGAPYHGLAERTRGGSKWTGRVDVIWPLIDLPLRWTKPRRIFVNSMSDLFHEELDWCEIATVYAIAVAAHHLRGHTFQILTKRSARMRGLLNDPNFWDHVNAEAGMHVMERTDPLNRRSDDARATLIDYGPDNPPPGIWLGVSVENQDAADKRIPDLLATPAALRFLSCEPLLGPVSLRQWLCLGGLHWIIAGGESGPGARPMHPDCVRSLRDQCAAASVAFFFKQWGEYTPGENVEGQRGTVKTATWFDGDWSSGWENLANTDGHIDDEPDLYRIGKKAAGDHLDGRQHHEFPVTDAA